VVMAAGNGTPNLFSGMGHGVLNARTRHSHLEENA
jgi:hypothetical protein